MNFQQVRQAEGKKDGNYPLKIVMYGLANSFEPLKFTEKGKRYQVVTVTDDQNETQKVKIWLGDNEPMGDGCVGKRLTFDIAPWRNDKNNQLYYNGFWNANAVTQPAKPPVNAPVAAPDGLKSFEGSPDTPQINTGQNNSLQARICALKCAVKRQVIMAEINKNLSRVDKGKIIEIAEFFLNWIYDRPKTDLDKQADQALSESERKAKQFEQDHNLEDVPDFL